MRFVFGILRVLMIAMLGLTATHAGSNSATYSHDFWLPQYHGQRLSYCLSDKQNCGKTVADHYCQDLGYEQAQRATLDHNVGVTRYLDKDTCCRGWHCAGFKLIRCAALARHLPKRNYYYRYKKFVLPRFHHYRIDSCYQDGKLCGKRAALAFCRYMGYEKVTEYHLEGRLAATRSLGNQKLCFGDCSGFDSITCFR